MSASEDKNQAISRGLLSAGLGLLANSQTPYGSSTIPGIAAGLSLGLKAYYDELDRIKTARKENLAAEHLAKKRQALYEAASSMDPLKRAAALASPNEFAKSVFQPPMLPKLFKFPEGDENVSQFIDPVTGEVTREIRAPRLPPLAQGFTPYQAESLALRKEQDARAAERAERAAEISERHLKLAEKREGRAELASRKLREGEATNIMHYTQMRAASKQLAELEKEGLDLADFGTQVRKEVAGGPLNIVIPAAEQQAKQIQRQWTGAYLYARTGKAATVGEIETNIKTFFPQIGDKPEQVAQKAQARADAESGVKLSTGRDEKFFSGPKEKGLSKENLEYIARKHGITIDEVLRRLGLP